MNTRKTRAGFAAMLVPLLLVSVNLTGCARQSSLAWSTFDMAGDDYIAGTDRARPKATFGQHEHVVDITIAIYLSANLEIAVSGNCPGDLAAFADQRGRT